MSEWSFDGLEVIRVDILHDPAVTGDREDFVDRIFDALDNLCTCGNRPAGPGVPECNYQGLTLTVKSYDEENGDCETCAMWNTTADDLPSASGLCENLRRITDEFWGCRDWTPRAKN